MDKTTIREDLLPIKARTKERLIELDPDELTLNEVLGLSIENVLLVTELTAIKGVGKVHKELLALKWRFTNEDN